MSRLKNAVREWSSSLPEMTEEPDERGVKPGIEFDVLEPALQEFEQEFMDALGQKPLTRLERLMIKTFAWWLVQGFPPPSR